MSAERPMVAVAWSNRPKETYYAACRAIEKAGGTPVNLKQVFCGFLDYKEGMLAACTDGRGMLVPDAAMAVKEYSWHRSNAEEVMKGIKAIVFPGGGDISPALYRVPKPAISIETVSAERDVSDYILMSWCLDHNIPILAICRGMQVLSVVSGADMIQDIEEYFRNMEKSPVHTHRMPPQEDRDFTYHDVAVTDKDSILYRLTGTAVIKNAPSWHHQAVKSVEGTNLKVTGVTPTEGIDIIEAVERIDKSFVLGLQSHPEISVVRENDETSLIYFKAIVNKAKGAYSASSVL